MNELKMRTIVNAELAKIHEQLYVNAKKICTYNYPQWGLELVSHTVESFLNQPIEKQYKICTTPSVKVSALERYLTSAMSMAIHSSSSPFYHRHRKPTEQIRELFPNYDYVRKMGVDDPYESNVDEKEDMIKELVENLHFYEKYLIQQHYYGQKTIGEISHETGIPTTTISKDIKKILRKLKEQIEKTL